MSEPAGIGRAFDLFGITARTAQSGEQVAVHVKREVRQLVEADHVVFGRLVAVYVVLAVAIAEVKGAAVDKAAQPARGGIAVQVCGIERQRRTDQGLFQFRIGAAQQQLAAVRIAQRVDERVHDLPVRFSAARRAAEQNLERAGLDESPLPFCDLDLHTDLPICTLVHGCSCANGAALSGSALFRTHASLRRVYPPAAARPRMRPLLHAPVRRYL